MPTINPQILQAGLETAQTTLGLGMGLMLERHQDRRQLRQQQALQGIQIQGQKELSDYNYAKQLEMWKATNYQAQVEQLKQAGLNPGMLYGMSGGGGTTTGSGSPGSVTGATAPVGEASSAHMINQMLQMGIMKAQKENIEADTELKKAGKPKTEAETEETKAKTQDLLQGIKNKKAEEQLTGIQDSLLRNELFEKYKTQDWRFTIYEHEAEQKIQQAKIALTQANLDQATINSKIEILTQNAIGAMLENAYKQAQISKTQEEINKITNDILLGWAQLSNEQQRTKIQQYTAEFQANHPGIMNVLGGAIQRLANGISKPSNETKVQ